MPRDQWPPVPVVHVAFQVMVGCGIVLAAVSVIGGLLWWRRRALPDDAWYLRTLVAAGPLGLIAVEAGWTVTEVGRQPWIIRGVMRTADAVTPMPGLVVPFAVFTGLYLVLGVVVIVLLRRQVFRSTRPLRPPTQAAHR
jgi:cytochrome d ubiquinol oxidase subunit I